MVLVLNALTNGLTLNMSNDITEDFQNYRYPTPEEMKTLKKKFNMENEQEEISQKHSYETNVSEEENQTNTEDGIPYNETGLAPPKKNANFSPADRPSTDMNSGVGSMDYNENLFFNAGAF